VVRRRCDEGEYSDVAAPHRRAANIKPMQQARVSVGSVTTAAAKCEMRSIVIIIELSYRYRDNFDLSYRLSIENSIWHIVTALILKLSRNLEERKRKLSCVIDPSALNVEFSFPITFITRSEKST